MGDGRGSNVLEGMELVVRVSLHLSERAFNLALANMAMPCPGHSRGS